MREIKTVLLIDRNHSFVRQICPLLEDRGMEVVLVEYFSTVRTVLNQQKVDAIVFDPRIEFDVDGALTFLRRLPKCGFEGVVIVLDVRASEKELFLNSGAWHLARRQDLVGLVSLLSGDDGKSVDHLEVVNGKENGVAGGG